MLLLTFAAHTIMSTFFVPYYCCPLHLHSFPTRRSSDLTMGSPTRPRASLSPFPAAPTRWRSPTSFASSEPPETATTDRKSTRLNSSHSQISYAVFCLKKKNLITLTTFLYLSCALISGHL